MLDYAATTGLPDGVPAPAASTTRGGSRAGAATTAPAPLFDAEVSAGRAGRRATRSSAARASRSRPQLWPTGMAAVGVAAEGQDRRRPSRPSPAGPWAGCPTWAGAIGCARWSRRSGRRAGPRRLAAAVVEVLRPWAHGDDAWRAPARSAVVAVGSRRQPAAGAQPGRADRRGRPAAAARARSACDRGRRRAARQQRPAGARAARRVRPSPPEAGRRAGRRWTVRSCWSTTWSTPAGRQGDPAPHHDPGGRGTRTAHERSTATCPPTMNAPASASWRSRSTSAGICSGGVGRTGRTVPTPTPSRPVRPPKSRAISNSRQPWPPRWWLRRFTGPAGWPASAVPATRAPGRCSRRAASGWVARPCDGPAAAGCAGCAPSRRTRRRRPGSRAAAAGRPQRVGEHVGEAFAQDRVPGQLPVRVRGGDGLELRGDVVVAARRGEHQPAPPPHRLGQRLVGRGVAGVQREHQVGAGRPAGPSRSGRPRRATRSAPGAAAIAVFRSRWSSRSRPRRADVRAPGPGRQR